MLTKAIRERNNLQDANIRLSIELADVRAQLADSVKENRRLRRGIYGKCFKQTIVQFGEEAYLQSYVCMYAEGPS